MLSDNLARLRKAKGYKSAKDFADALEMPYTSYNDYEKGAWPNEKNLFKIADMLGVSVEELLTGAAPKATGQIKVYIRYSEQRCYRGGGMRCKKCPIDLEWQCMSDCEYYDEDKQAVQAAGLDYSLDDCKYYNVAESVKVKNVKSIAIDKDVSVKFNGQEFFWANIILLKVDYGDGCGYVTEYEREKGV